MDELDLTAALSALAQPTRREIFLTIARKKGGMNSTQIAEATGTPPNGTSTHLTVLRNAGLVTAMRTGRTVNYTARADAIRKIIRILEGAIKA